MLLAQWNYTREEWARFRNWSNRKKGFVFYLLCLINPLKSSRIPEIKINSDRILVNDLNRPFRGGTRKLLGINIIETNNGNVLVIYFELKNKVYELMIPIPKGRLKEAIMIEELLLVEPVSIT